MTTAASPAPTGNPLQLALATGAFALCFAVFGSVSAMVPTIQQRMGLSELQAWLVIAVPVLLGSLGRIPLGVLTDRYGGRLVFAWTMGLSIVPCVLLGFATEYWQLLVLGFFVGIGLASFSVGVGFTSRWYPPQKQGGALGVYGAGNVGQSLAAFGAPVLVATLGYAWGFWGPAIALAIWLAVFLALARNVPTTVRPRTLTQALGPMRESMTWILSAYYFLTFGGFVAMSISLPKFLVNMFEITPTDAGMRAAGFIVLATFLRPVGGFLADRFGGRRLLLFVFPATAVAAVFLACPMISTFTVGALAMAAFIGIGNGAVFKLVPEYFPQSVGSVTGVVGAAGGLGGFFPPLVVGAIYEATGSYSWGFILLGGFALACFVLVLRIGRVAPPPATPVPA